MNLEQFEKALPILREAKQLLRAYDIELIDMKVRFESAEEDSVIKFVKSDGDIA